MPFNKVTLLNHDVASQQAPCFLFASLFILLFPLQILCVAVLEGCMAFDYVDTVLLDFHPRIPVVVSEGC